MSVWFIFVACFSALKRKNIRTWKISINYKLLSAFGLSKWTNKREGWIHKENAAFKLLTPPPPNPTPNLIPPTPSSSYQNNRITNRQFQRIHSFFSKSSIQNLFCLIFLYFPSSVSFSLVNKKTTLIEHICMTRWRQRGTMEFVYKSVFAST